jgi:hypothetical protein
MLKLLILLVISFGVYSQPNLASCIEDHQEAKNTLPLQTKDDGSDLYIAVRQDQKYASCFIKKLAIPRTASPKEQAQAVLNYTSTIIKYEADMPEGKSSDLNRPGTKLPSRTVVDGKGDCEDKSVLAALMLNELGFDTFVIKRPPISNGIGHIFLGIRADYNTGLKCGDEFFLAFDPTIKGAKVGDKEDGLNQVKSFKCGRI